MPKLALKIDSVEATRQREDRIACQRMLYEHRRLKTFASWLLLIAIFTTTLLANVSSAQEARSVPDQTRPRPTTFKKVAIIEFHREIDMNQHRYFKNRFAAAERAGVDLLIVEIDSPGGLKIESLEMSRMLRDCDWAYTVCLITKEAISGGALIALGCDEIQIAPHAKFGDIGEIGFDPEQMAFRLIEPKIESYLYRDARDIAESKGRPPALAESMVDKDALVYFRPKLGKAQDAKDDQEDEEVEIADAGAAEEKAKLANSKTFNGDRFEFKIVRSDAELKPDPPWNLVPETAEERFFTASGQRTFELGIANGLVEGREELADTMGVELSSANVYRHTVTDNVVHTLNTSWVTGLLIIVGLIALYVELSAPGIGIGGLLAGLCALLFFWSRFFGGTSGWLEVLLFVAGVTFVLFEIFIIPGFGIPGATGLFLMLASVVLASQDFVFPTTADQWNQSLTTMVTLALSGCVFIVAAVFITKRLGSIPIFNQLVLNPTEQNSEQSKDNEGSGKTDPQTHPHVSVGDWGKTESPLRPAGRAMFAGRSVDVVSDGSFVDRGLQVKVTKISGNIITVAVVEQENA